MNSGLCEHCLRVAYLVTDMTILLGMDEKATMDVQLAAIYQNNKIVIKKADFEKLLNKTYAAGYQDGLKEPRPAQVWMTSKRGFDTEPKVLSI